MANNWTEKENATSESAVSKVYLKKTSRSEKNLNISEGLAMLAAFTPFSYIVTVFENIVLFRYFFS